MTINNMADLCRYFHADEPSSLNRRIYKDTDCGASILVRIQDPNQGPVDTVTLVVGPGDDNTTDLNTIRINGEYVGPVGEVLNRYRDRYWFEDLMDPWIKGLYYWDYPLRAGWKIPFSEFLTAHPEAKHERSHPLKFAITLETNEEELPEIVTTAARIVEGPDGLARIHSFGYGFGLHNDVPLGEHYSFAHVKGEAVWARHIREFFQLDADTTSASIWTQNWYGDEVTLTGTQADFVLRKVFRANARGWGWRTNQSTIWLHCGDQRWKDVTMETKLHGFTIQSIVEGSDATVDSTEFLVPVEEKEIADWMSYMDDATTVYWKAANTDLYRVHGNRRATQYYVRLNWGDVEWEGRKPRKPLRDAVDKLLKEAYKHGENLHGDGFWLERIEEDVSLY